MNCKDFRNQIEEYLEGSLSPEEEALFLGHRDRCSSCRAELELFRGLRQRPAAPVSPPPAFLIRPATERTRRGQDRSEAGRP